MESILVRMGNIFEKHERRVSSFALIAGFIFDSLTLRSVEQLFENLIILTYIVLAGGSIILLNYLEVSPPQRSISTRIYNFLPFFIQFAFGALFSAFFIFYTRSATIASSWPFIVILLVLLIGNEFFRNYYQKLTFQVSVFFLTVFSFSIYFVPVLLDKIGPLIFILSGLISLAVILFFSRLLFRIVPSRYKENERDLRISLVSIFVLMNVLYFLNLIPPIPLALKNAGVYYHVEKLRENYLVVGEVKSWYESLPFSFSQKIQLERGAPLYVFSSVFAPTDLDTTIVHDWQYFDEENNEWVSTTKIPFDIRGGRREGYRAFSKKENITPGKWRVDVETKSGQIIGRVEFEVENIAGPLIYGREIL